MFSHHSHSGSYCAHAKAGTSPSSMLSKAYEQGFQLYCLSEHVPRCRFTQLYPEELEAKLQPLDLERRFEEYLIEGRRCAESWKGRMEVLVGAELENIDEENMEYLTKILNGSKKGEEEVSRDQGGAMIGKGRVDYLVGSLHHVDSIPIDFDKATFESVLENFQTVEEVVQEEQDVASIPSLRQRAHLRLILRYLDQQYDLIKHFQPEVVGHFDLCRLYQYETPMTTASKVDEESKAILEKVDEAVHRTVRLICNYGGLFEVNSASIRKGWPTPYPGPDVLDVILSYGGRLCFSDDAHSHEQVGLNFLKVKEYLVSKGVEEVWKLELSRDDPDSNEATTFPRGTKAVKVLDWTNNSFWQTQPTSL